MVAGREPSAVRGDPKLRSAEPPAERPAVNPGPGPVGGTEPGEALRRAGLEVHDDRHLRLVPQADDAAVLVVEDLVGLRKVVLAKQAPHRALSVLAAGLIRAQLLSAH